MERRIQLNGITNFRDLGGYTAENGATVRWRTIFRSDTLSSVTDEDVEAICDLGVNVVFDLRYGDERELEPNCFRDHLDVELLEMGLDQRPDTSFLDSFDPTAEAGEQAHAWLMGSYRQYPFLYAKAYRLMIERLSSGARVVVHCTAGKDRAGIAAAMMLTALGVPRDFVFEDYLLTNQYWDRGGRVLPDMDPGVVASIFSAREEYLTATFEAIQAECGTITNYFRDVVGVDDGMRKAFAAACLD